MDGSGDGQDRGVGAATTERPVLLRTRELDDAMLTSLRRMLEGAYGNGFSEEDWQHSLGGTHVLIREDGRPIAHASIVGRMLETGGRGLRTGYVEAVATDPTHQGRGLATAVMRTVEDFIREHYELGALSTAVDGFYERYGWERWLGPTWVRTATGPERTSGDDGSVMVFRTPATPPIMLTDPISCEWRCGDVW